MLHSLYRFTLQYLSYAVVFFVFITDTATSTEESHEFMGRPNAPLGTVWVDSLDDSLKRHHFSMMQCELQSFAKLVSTNLDFLKTNLALFKLYFRKNDGTDKIISEEVTTPLLSGGFMLTSVKPRQLEGISAKRKRLEDEVSKQQRQLIEVRKELNSFSGKVGSDPKRDFNASKEAYGSILGKIALNEARYVQAQKAVEDLATKEEQYKPKIFAEPKYNDHSNAVYDTEQTITRIIDHYIQSAIITPEEITINEVTINIRDINAIILSIHTRFDMCPFCSMFLAHSLQKWRSQLRPIPMLAIVTSRQEYRCEYPFIVNKPYYIGHSMRSFSWRMDDKGESLDGIKKIAEDGLVIQYSFTSKEIYSSTT